MIKKLNLLITLLIFPVILYGQNWENDFEQGNKDYSAGEYAAAIDNYLKIVAAGGESGEVYFNLGNAFYKMGEIGRAILYYEKANKFLTGDEALEQNLKIAQLKIVDKIEPLPQLFLTLWKDAILDMATINLFAWVCLGFFIIALIFLSLNIVYSKRIYFRTGIILFSIFIINLFLLIGKIHKLETENFAIIMDKKVSVVGEPSLSGSEVFILHEGTKVKINRLLDGWYEIAIADGKTGWIKSHSLEII